MSHHSYFIHLNHVQDEGIVSIVVLSHLRFRIGGGSGPIRVERKLKIPKLNKTVLSLSHKFSNEAFQFCDVF